MAKKKFTVEYDMMKVTPALLWPYLFSEVGLSQWFADDVEQDGKRFVFHWESSSQVALLMSMRTAVYVRFHWEDDGKEHTYFEMRISRSELTDSTNLTITDFADDEADIAEMTDLWNQQIDRLKRCLGLN